VLVAAFAFAGATDANAAIITSHDGQGRTITFDVRAATADTEWYASVLSAAAHGNEISEVRIIIVREPQVQAFCGGADAAACYDRNSATIVVPAGKSKLLETVLLHEYGHHLDTYWHVSGVQELNGTAAWWAARGMAALLANHQVAFDYSLGWSHSIGEVFAEDYAYIHTHSRYGMLSWLKPPDAALESAMFAELGTPTAPLPFAPEVPLILNRSGTLAPRDGFSVPFGLLGPGRRVTVTATVSNPKRKGIRARAQLVCDERVVVTRTFGKGQSKRTFDVPNLGPATCDVRIVSSVSATLRYTLHIALAVETA
jgi:hypothetical protein